MRKLLPVLFLLFLTVGIPALAFFAGHRLTYLKMRKKPLLANDLVADRVAKWRQNETMAGAYALAKISLDGVERCYYASPDFERVTWIGKDVPTPFVGFAPAPGRLASGFINSMQFRYARELATPKPKDVCRVFVIGGSTAYGSGATSNDATIGGRLEHYLNESLANQGIQCEVVTAAACAWTSTHERILVENRLVELEPDVVVALSGHNDAYWGAVDRNVLWFRAFQDDYFFLLANTVLACNFDEEFPSADPGTGAPISSALSARRLARNVAFARHALATVGADYAFALQPLLVASKKPRTLREGRMADRQEAVAGLLPRYEEFRKALQAEPGLHFVDLTAVFDDVDGQTDVFLDGCHFGDRGNDQIARFLHAKVLPIVEERIKNRAVAKAKHQRKPLP